MKYNILLLFFILSHVASFSQIKKITDPLTPCSGSADALPGKYTDHTNPKYPHSLKGNAQEKPAMTKQLIALEKIEEASRANFQLTGCVARVNFSGNNKNTFGDYAYNTYGYQLGLYQNVCHVTEKVVKTVDEYQSVLRVGVNPSLSEGNHYGERGDFYVTDKAVRYEIPIDASLGANYERDRFNNRSRITRYITEEMVLTHRSDNYKDKHGDFLKLINGNGYVENWMRGSRDDKPNSKSYKWIDRHYIIARPGIPLLVPVTRKAYLDALLEYYEIEKNNFLWTVAYTIKNQPANASICQADKAAYSKIYESKKSNVQQLLTSSTEWLQQPAVVIKDLRPNDYANASNGLLDFEKFYDGDSKGITLYEYNPVYFKANVNQPLQPQFLEVQIRYELSEDKGFSERYFTNFLENYNLDALRKILTNNTK